MHCNGQFSRKCPSADHSDTLPHLKWRLVTRLLGTGLVAPPPEHKIAADLLSAAADAIVAGDLKLARDRLRQADMPALFEFARRLMGSVDVEIHRRLQSMKVCLPWATRTSLRRSLTDGPCDLRDV